MHARTFKWPLPFTFDDMVYLNIGSVVVGVMHGVKPILHGIGRSVCLFWSRLFGRQARKSLKMHPRNWWSFAGRPAKSASFRFACRQAYKCLQFINCASVQDSYNSVTRGCMHAWFLHLGRWQQCILYTVNEATYWNKQCHIITLYVCL